MSTSLQSRRLYHARIAQGLCPRCRRPTAGYTLCDTCRIRRNRSRDEGAVTLAMLPLLIVGAVIGWLLYGLFGGGDER